jgi:hypothetical protein
MRDERSESREQRGEKREERKEQRAKSREQREKSRELTLCSGNFFLICSNATSSRPRNNTPLSTPSPFCSFLDLTC